MSKSQKLNIADASDEQLRAFSAVIGVVQSTNPATHRETLITKLSKSWPQDYIMIDVEGSLVGKELEVSEDGVSVAELTPEEASERKVWINIQTSSEEGGSQPVFVSVNGRPILLPRGERIEVRTCFVEALQHAVTDVFDPLKDGGISPTPRKSPRFPLQIFDGPERKAA